MGKHSDNEPKSILKLILVGLILIAVIVVGFMFIFNGNNKTATYTAESIVNSMKEKNENIGRVVVYTETTDLNNLLGRPNQYTSKVTFEDKRLEQQDINNEYLTEERNEPIGGTIEVFANKKDMEKRKEYIENFSSSSMFAQYIYSKGNALLRIDKNITPSQAKEYKRIFNEIVQ